MVLIFNIDPYTDLYTNIGYVPISTLNNVIMIKSKADL